MSEVTRIRNAIARGNAKATDELLPLMYEGLCILAAQKLSHESPGQTLQATALVHEAYLRLVGDGPRTWENRGHFFAVAAEAMRRILVESARRKRSQKRGGALKRIDLGEVMLGTERSASAADVLALDEAVSRLMEMDPVKGELVKLRFFAGLTNEQAAAVPKVSRNTADRYWAYARAWIRLKIQESDHLDGR